jgi:N-acyl-L-homoserine lactone synthetase
VSDGWPDEPAETSLAEQEALDRVCAEVLEFAVPLRVGPAGSPAERDECFRLRYRCVVEEGWADAGEFADGMEQDAYDRLATHICAWSGSELAGTVRLMFPRPGVALPIEEEFDVDLWPPGQVVDGGRLVVAPRHRGKAGHVVLAALFARCWQVGRERGFSRFAAVAPDGIVKLYRSLGMRIDELGEPRLYWGQERQPIMISGADSELVFSGSRVPTRRP